MLSAFRRRALVLLPVVTAGLLLAAARLPAVDEPAADPKAEAALKALADRCQEPSGDREKLAQDLQAFRVANPGPYAVRAAVLLAGLPSPLDKLDPAAIPEIERFTWQPKELVAVIGEHRGRQGAPVTCVAASADGALAASGGGSLIRLWRPADMRLLSMVGHGAVLSIAFSHDGKQLVSGGADGAVRVWDIADEGKTFTLHAQVQAATTPVYSVAFGPDGKSVASGCGDNNIKLYAVGEKELKELHIVSDHTLPVTGVAYAPDGKTLVSCSNDKTVRLWDVTPDKLISRAVLDGPAAPLSVAVSPTGAAFAVPAADGTVSVWNLPAASRTKPRTVLPAVGGAVYSTAFTKDGGALAAACADGAIRMWATSGAPTKEKSKLDGHAGPATCVAYGPEDKLLYSGGGDWVVRSWEPATKKERFQPFSHLSHVYAAAFAPDGKTLATGAEDRELRLWDLKQTPIRTRNYTPPRPESPAGYCLAYSPDGKTLALGGASTSAMLFDAANGKLLRNLTNHPSAVTYLAFTPDGKQILSASGKVLILWDAVKGVEANRFKEHETNLGCAALSPDGRFAVSGSGSYLYDPMGKIVLDKDNKYVFTDCVLRLWDIESGKELDAVKGNQPFCAAAFGPDGRSLSSCAQEPIVRKWDATKQPLTEASTLTGTYGYAGSLIFSPDGRTLCTRVLDGKVIVWDTATGKRLNEWVMNENVGGVAYAPDSRHLAVGLGTGVVYILRIGDPQKAAP